MSNQKEHTPGPWYWHNCGGYHLLVSGPLSEEGRYPDGPQVISDGSAGGEYGPDIDVDGPDAKLIAAAPDLLEALQGMLRAYDVPRECCNKGHDAIDKAIGGPR